MAIPAKSIDEVLIELDLIIASTVAENNFLGIFAYVYRRTTAQIKQAILNNLFEDNARMELLDVTFANMYLTAYQSFVNNQDCSSSWATAFSAKNDKITIIQHIMLGMNAHINLDLGVAAATFSPGLNIEGLKNDFMKVNQILSDLTNEMQDRVSKVSKLMILLDWLGKNTDELIINFSMIKAREQAWNLTGILAACNKSERNPIIYNTDQAIAILGQLVKNPPGKIIAFVLKIIGFWEEKNVKVIISNLEAD
jgi:hypothetical protein